MAATEQEIRDALAWETGGAQPDEKDTWEWLWEAIQGDFNEERSTGQIAFDAAVSMIPVVDQICDVRDLIANCKAIAQSDEEESDTWKWVALALTLLGLFPTLGSLVKGALKIVFLFVRRYGRAHVGKAVDEAMTWVVTFLRKPDVQKYLSRLRVDEVFKWLADEVRALRGKVNTASLLAAFDRGIGLLKGLLGKVRWLPGMGERAARAIALVEAIRRKADAPLARALGPVQDIFDRVITRLEMEHLVYRSGIVNVSNVHFRGTLPEAQAVALMRKADPLPPWLSRGRPGKWKPLEVGQGEVSSALTKAEQLAKADARAKAKRLGVPESDVPVEPWPALNEQAIGSFHTLRPDRLLGPAKLYRVVSPSSGAMGDCWFSEEVFEQLMKAPDPKTAWRKYLAVWPDWNANGQFVVFELKKGEELKVWRGTASSQVKGDSPDLDFNLEGGWEQVRFTPTKSNAAAYDTMRVYQRTGNTRSLKPVPMSYEEYRALPASKRHAYVVVREQINDPRIKGPYDTNWGTTDFDPQLQDARIGLPALPGQVTNK